MILGISEAALAYDRAVMLLQRKQCMSILIDKIYTHGRSGPSIAKLAKAKEEAKNLEGALQAFHEFGVAE